MNDASDNWWDLKHKGENMLLPFSDTELQAELNRRRRIELVKLAKGREAFAYFTLSCKDETYAEWELHIIFTDGSNHCFTFSSRVGHTDESMREFRELYYPNLTCFNYDDYVRFKKSKCKGKKRVRSNDKCISTNR